jgi:hypothetical protein
MSGLKEREKYSAAKRAPKVTADVSTTGPNRDDLKWSTLENRKGLLADVLRGTVDGIAFNAHFDCEGATIFKHACMPGCEGIVSKRLGSHYRSGRVDPWLTIKNSKSPAVRREREDGGAKRWASGRRRK